MIKKVLYVFVSLVASTLYTLGQSTGMFKKGDFQISVGYSSMPINTRDAQIKFRYIDGGQNAAYITDTISANYSLKHGANGNALNFGIGYFITDKVRASVNVKPHINSFLSNKSKNGKVYGVQFDVGIDYFVNISERIEVSLGTTASRVLGGFGITSGGPKNKEYLAVNQNKLYDNDIGFHIIDNCWAFNQRIGVHFKIAKGFTFFANTGYQFTTGRNSRLNFAGTTKDGEVKWNAKNYDDVDVNLEVGEKKITNSNFSNLPYSFSGITYDIGFIFNLQKKIKNK